MPAGSDIRLWVFGLFQLRIGKLDASPSNVTTRFHQYRDAEAETTTRVQRTVGRPSKVEAFFAPEVALV